MQITNRNQLGSLLNSMGLKGLAAEVGVLFGENADNLLREWNGYGLFLIDPFDLDKCGEYVDATRDNDFGEALARCTAALSKYPLRTILINENSNVAHQLLSGVQLDCVYLDGNHHEPQISKDLENYWSLVKPGGLLCGHDYFNQEIPGIYRCEVKAAVDRFLSSIDFKQFMHTPECTSWYILK